MTLNQAAEFIANRPGTQLTAEEVLKILQPVADRLRAKFDEAARLLHELSKGEGDWRLSLGDGLTVVVNFSAPPSKRHLEAFVKVFTAMAESYVEAASDPNLPSPPEKENS